MRDIEVARWPKVVLGRSSSFHPVLEYSIITSGLRGLIISVVVDSIELLGKHWECFVEMPSRKQPQKASRTFCDSRCIGEDSIVHKTPTSRPEPTTALSYFEKAGPCQYYGVSAAAVLQAERQLQRDKKQARGDNVQA